jgi:hypothetical protein
VLAAALPSANSDRQAKLLFLLELTILVPVFNDWAAAELLVEQLDSVFGEHALSGHLLFIDDGSLETMPEQFPKIPPHNIPQIQTLELRTNLGHQRALRAGLVHLRHTNATAPVVIMDADGEDGPSDIPKLLEKFVVESKRKVIFAAEACARRGFIFKLFYKLYRTIHRLVVGLDPGLATRPPAARHVQRERCQGRCRIFPPLAGITVADLIRYLAGPFCTQILGDYEAEVIKIDGHGRVPPSCTRLTVQPRTTCNSRIADALRIGPPGTSAERPFYAPSVSVQLSPASQGCHTGFLGFRACLRLFVHARRACAPFALPSSYQSNG